MGVIAFVLQTAGLSSGESRHRRDEEGASLVEYALLLALVAVVSIVALSFLGGSVSNTLNSVGSSLSN